jgi:alkaline phosphatase D
MKTEGVRNLVWLATDVHYARLLRYEPSGDLGGLVFHEFIAGPANAGSGPPLPLSQTFAPIELFARGRQPDPSRPNFYNFGLIRITADGVLRVEVRDADGLVPSDPQGRPGALTLTPTR